MGTTLIDAVGDAPVSQDTTKSAHAAISVRHQCVAQGFLRAYEDVLHTFKGMVRVNFTDVM